MRELNLDDALNTAAFVDDCGARAQVAGMVASISAGDSDLEKIGIGGILAFLFTIAKKGNRAGLYELLSGPLELEPDAVGRLTFHQLKEACREMAEINNLKDFFGSVSDILRS